MYVMAFFRSRRPVYANHFGKKNLLQFVKSSCEVTPVGSLLIMVSETEVFGWSRIFLVETPTPVPNWIIFYTALLSWEFLLKCYNFF